MDDLGWFGISSVYASDSVIRVFGSSPDLKPQVHLLSCTREGLHVSPPAGRSVT
jgi:hypothetical protein